MRLLIVHDIKTDHVSYVESHCYAIVGSHTESGMIILEQLYRRMQQMIY